MIDLGPEGGGAGGKIIAQGTPEDVAKTPDSYTGHYPQRVLNGSKARFERQRAV